MKLHIYPLCLIFVISVLSFLITDIHWVLFLAVHNDVKLFFLNWKEFCPLRAQESRWEGPPIVHLSVFISIMFYPILCCCYHLIWLSLSVFQCPVPLNTVFTSKFDGMPSLDGILCSMERHITRKCLSQIPAAAVKPVSVLIWNR